MTTKEHDNWITIDVAQRVTGASRAGVYRLISDYKIECRYHRLGKARRAFIRERDIVNAAVEKQAASVLHDICKEARRDQGLQRALISAYWAHKTGNLPQ